jgi:flagellar biogenesis protein FliO
MEVVERMYLGPKKSILLIRIGHEFMLVGLAASQISFLSKVEGPARNDVVQSKFESLNEQYDTESRADSGQQATVKDTSLQRALKHIIQGYFDRMGRREVGR